LNKQDDKRPIIYIGFGSIIVPDPEEVTRTIAEAVLKADVRAIVSKGWSSRMQDKAQGLETNEASIQDRKSQDETLPVHNEFPDTIYWVKSVPHDWLFPKMSGVVHHGGAGTTAAGLRAGIPTVVKPFFGDQFFWGERLEEMGIGLCLKEMSVDLLSSAIKTITTDESMKKTARLVGEKIRAVSTHANNPFLSVEERNTSCKC
jgi:sterol 3beta-glucosyltransferase